MGPDWWNNVLSDLSQLIAATICGMKQAAWASWSVDTLLLLGAGMTVKSTFNRGVHIWSRHNWLWREEIWAFKGPVHLCGPITASYINRHKDAWTILEVSQRRFDNLMCDMTIHKFECHVLKVAVSHCLWQSCHGPQASNIQNTPCCKKDWR